MTSTMAFTFTSAFAAPARTRIAQACQSWVVSPKMVMPTHSPTQPATKSCSGRVKRVAMRPASAAVTSMPTPIEVPRRP